VRLSRVEVTVLVLTSYSTTTVTARKGSPADTARLVNTLMSLNNP